jgi:cell division protein FtsN
MPKDYAKRVLTTSRKPKKKKLRLEFVIIPIVLAVIVVIWMMTHTNDIATAEQSWFQRLKSIGHKAAPVKKEASNAKNLAETHSEPSVHFDFYNQLPTMQVPTPTFTEDHASAKPKPPHQMADKNAKALSVPHYILLFGEFKNASAAGELRVSLMLAECEAEIIAVPSKGSKLYRVQSNPFMTQAEAKRLQQILLRKGVSSELKQV